MSSNEVKMPPEWMHEPLHVTRSELLEERNKMRLKLALDAQHESEYSKRNFRRSEHIFRDSYRKSGVFDRTRVVDDSTYQSSGLPTRSELFEKRKRDKNRESLKFEPPEIMRLRDLPKMDRLANWWKSQEEYVEDPSCMLKTSIRLQLAARNDTIGPLDPGKIRSTLSAEQQRQWEEKRVQLALKPTQMEPNLDGHELIALNRSPDLFPQPRKAKAGESGMRFSSLPPTSTFMCLVSPIKVSSSKRKERQTLAVQNIFHDGVTDREKLEQLKKVSPTMLSPVSPIVTKDSARSNATSFRLPSARSGIRCSGFTKPHVRRQVQIEK